MKIVKESISFKKGISPTKAMDIGVMKSWQKMGISLGWVEPADISMKSYFEDIKEAVEKKLPEFDEAIHLLMQLGAKPKDMVITEKKVIKVFGYSVTNQNNTVGPYLTLEDARTVINILNKYSPVNEDEPWFIDYPNHQFGRYNTFIRVSVDNIDWLKGLEKTRKICKTV